MKPVEPAPAANLTVAQLGKVLTQKPAPSPKTDGKPSAPATSREPLPANTGDEADDKPPVLSQSAIPNDGEGDDTPAGDEPQGDDAPPGDEPPVGDDAPAGDEPAAPAQISDVVTARLNTELQPLIDELTKAGAKGALQILQKRIPKLVDQRDTERNARLQAEQKLTELEGELETAKTQKSEDRGPKAEGTHPAVAKLSSQISEVDGFIKLFRSNPNGVEIDDGQGGKTMLTGDEVSDHLERLRDKRTELMTERKLAEQRVADNFQQSYQQSHALAVRVYPWLTKPDAPEQARLKAMLTAMPGLKQFPDYELVVGHYLRGEAAAVAEAKAKGQAPASRKAPPSREPTKVVTEAPGGKAGPADAKTTAQQAVKKAEEQFKKTGKKEDLQKWESAKQRLKRA